MTMIVWKIFFCLLCGERLKQLALTRFNTNNHASFHLRLEEKLLKHQNV